MKQPIFLAILFFCVLTKLHSQKSYIKQKFLKKIDSCGLYFNPSPNFGNYVEKDFDTSALHSCKYDYAVYDSVNQYEARWQVANLIFFTDTTNKNEIKVKDQSLLFASASEALVFNLSDQTKPLPKMSKVPSQNVLHDFNTDEALQWITKTPEKKFTNSYNSLLVFSYFKKDHAIVNIFYLLKEFNPQTFVRFLDNTQRLLVFKKE